MAFMGSRSNFSQSISFICAKWDLPRMSCCENVYKIKDSVNEGIAKGDKIKCGLICDLMFLKRSNSDADIDSLIEDLCIN